MSTPRSSELPIACTLGADDGPARMRRWHALVEMAHPTASRNGRTLEVHFEAGIGVQAELVTLATAEQHCCSFVTWSVTEADGHPVLRVLAEPDSPQHLVPIAALSDAT